MWLLALTGASSEPCGPFGSPDGDRLELLGGALSFRGYDRPPGVDPGMGIGPPVTEASAEMFTRAPHTLIVSAYDLHRFAGALDPDAVRRAIAKWVPGVATVEPVPVTEPLRAVAVTPAVHGEPIPELAVVTAHPDGSAQVVTFTFDGLLRGRPECLAVALELAATLIAGPRSANEIVGRAHLPEWGGLTIELPGRWALERVYDELPAHRFTEVVALGERAAMVGLSTSRSDDEPPGPTIRGRVLGDAVRWHAIPGPDRTTAYTTVVPHRSELLRVWFVAPTEADVQRVQAIAESLRRP